MDEKLEQMPLPFKDEIKEKESQKTYTGGLYNLNIFGLPDGINGLDRRNQLMWNKNGVALAYMLVPTLKSAVDVISQNLSSVPMTLKDKNGNVVQRSDASGSSTSVFLGAIERSYKYYGVPLFELWANAILLYGECVIEKVPTTVDIISGLKWLNPLSTYAESRRVTDDSEMIYAGGQTVYKLIKKFYYSGSYGITTYDEDEVLYSRAFNPVNDIFGYSSALNALSKANITIEFDNFTLAFYANNGHPGVIISPRDKLVGEAQIAEWQRSWREKYRGSNNQFKTHINSFPFDVETFPILDVSKPLEVSKNAETQILRAFRVQPEMIGDTTENSYQFSKESKNAFMQTVVRPLALSISNCINHSGVIGEISPEESEYKFGFDFSEFENIAKTDIDKQQVLENQVKSGGISIGQYQRSLGKEVVKGADDTYMIPQGFIVVKKEDLVNPEKLQQQLPDKTGPDTNPIQQKPRETQSETEEDESINFFGSKGYKSNGVGELYVYLPLSNNKEVLKYQREAKKYINNADWQSPPTFHITLFYSPEFDYSLLENIKLPELEEIRVVGDTLDYFNTPDGKALHIRISDVSNVKLLQKTIYSEFSKYTNNISEFSKPENFNPHITLCYTNDDGINDYLDMGESPFIDTKVNEYIVSMSDYDPYVVVKSSEYKSYSKFNQKSSNFNFKDGLGMDMAEEYRKQYFDGISPHYDHISFEPTEEVIESSKSLNIPDNRFISDKQITPDYIKELYSSMLNDSLNDNIVFDWCKGKYLEIKNADLSMLNLFTNEEVEYISNSFKLTKDDMLDILKELSDG